MASNLASLKLASAGNDIRIWDMPDFSIGHHFSCRNTSSFSTVHWSPDFSQLVSVPTHGQNLLLTFAKANVLHHLEINTNETNTVARFNNTSSRFIGIGTASGKFLIWDIKYKKPKKIFTGCNDQITCLHFNWNDSFAVSGTVTGGLVFYNQITGQSSAPVFSPGTEAIRGLQYSYSKKSLLGCVSDDGRVILWDANTRQVSHRFQSAHIAPATGLTFSPINSVLLISVGLDKRINFYDVKTKNCVRVFDCEAPLTSVDFCEDGFTLAVGSNRGKIYIFDLRCLNQVPIKMIAAHTSTVHSLAFQNTLVGSLVKEKSIGHANVTKHMSETESSKYYQETNSTNEIISNFEEYTGNVKMERNSSLISEIFSPLRTDISTVENDVLNSASPAESISETLDLFSPLQNEIREKNFEKNNNSIRFEYPPNSLLNISSNSSDNSKNILSPLAMTFNLPKNLCSPISRESVDEQLIAKQANESFGASIDGLKKCETSEVLSVDVKELDNEILSCDIDIKLETDVGNFDHVDAEKEKTESSSNAKLQSVVNDVKFKEMEEVEHMELSNGMQLQHVKNNDNISEAAEILNNESNNIGHDIENIAFSNFVNEGTRPNEPITPQAFHTEFIRQTVTDAIEDMRDEIRRDLNHFYIQILRQIEELRSELLGNP